MCNRVIRKIKLICPVVSEPTVWKDLNEESHVSRNKMNPYPSPPFRVHISVSTSLRIGISSSDTHERTTLSADTQLRVIINYA